MVDIDGEGSETGQAHRASKDWGKEVGLIRQANIEEEN